MLRRVAAVCVLVSLAAAAEAQPRHPGDPQITPQTRPSGPQAAPTMQGTPTLDPTHPGDVPNSYELLTKIYHEVLQLRSQLQTQERRIAALQNTVDKINTLAATTSTSVNDVKTNLKDVARRLYAVCVIVIDVNVAINDHAGNRPAAPGEGPRAFVPYIGDRAACKAAWWQQHQALTNFNNFDTPFGGP